MSTDKDKKKEVEKEVKEEEKEEEKEKAKEEPEKEEPEKEEPEEEEHEEEEEPEEEDGDEPEEDEPEEDEPEEDEPEEDEVEEPEKAEEKPEKAAAEEKPEKAAAEEKPEKAEKKKDPGAETQQAMDEMDEGWPKSWIVTTAILGIVAIIIIARLVGAAKGKEGQVEPPGGPEAGRHEQKGKPQPKHDPKRAPRHEPKHEAKPKGAEAAEALRLDLKKVSVPNGLYCIGKDKKLRKMNDHFHRHGECLIETGSHTAFRLDFKPSTGESEFNAQILPPPDADVEFLMGSLCLPGGTSYWIGGTAHLPGQRAIMVVINNPAPKAVVMETIKLTTMKGTRRPVGSVITNIKAAKPLFSKVGHHCLGTDKKLHPLEEGKPVPKACNLLVKDATVFQVEVKRQLVASPIKVSLQAAQSRTHIAEGVMVPRTTPEGPADVFEGSIRGLEDNAVLVLTNTKKDVTIKSLLFTVKKN